jgi:hypothetical protein
MNFWSFTLLALTGAVLADLDATKSTPLIDTAFLSVLDGEFARRETGPSCAFFAHNKMKPISKLFRLLSPVLVLRGAFPSQTQAVGVNLS